MKKIRKIDSRTVHHLRCLNREMRRGKALGCYYACESLIAVDTVSVFNRALKMWRKDTCLPFEFYVERVFAFVVFHELGHAYEDLYLRRKPTEKFADNFRRWVMDHNPDFILPTNPKLDKKLKKK